MGEPNYAIDMARAEAFYNAIRSYWPDLPDGALVPGYAGVRARTADINDFSDFIIHGPADTGHKALRTLRDRFTWSNRIASHWRARGATRDERARDEEFPLNEDTCYRSRWVHWLLYSQSASGSRR